MLQYPSIGTVVRDVPIYAFDKLDGSNIRVEWTRKGGFAKFGSRRLLIDERHSFLSDVIPLFMEKYSEGLGKVFRDARYEKVTAFYEYHSPNSKFGRHVDEVHDVTLFDVNVSRRGFMLPGQFVDTFGEFGTAALLYQGFADDAFVESVVDGSLEGMTREGVVCKGGYDERNRLLSFKVKSREWLEDLKVYCDGDEDLFVKLV